MRDPKPVTRTMNISVVKNTLSSVVNDVFRTDSRIVVEKSGIPVAAIISADDLTRLARFEQEREERFRAVDRARAAFADVPSDEIEQATDRIIALVSLVLASPPGARRSTARRARRRIRSGI